jgi:hypothetical protein
MSTRSQIFRAHQLAQAFGHEWANAIEREQLMKLLPEGEEPALEDVIALIRAITRVRRGMPEWAGIEAPSVEVFAGEATIVHSSGSGRYEWTVFPNGETHIRIRRPGYVAIYAYVDSWGSVTVSKGHSNDLGEAVEAVIEERHIDALHFALAAVLTEVIAAPAVRSFGWEAYYPPIADDRVRPPRRWRPIPPVAEEAAEEIAARYSSDDED